VAGWYAPSCTQSTLAARAFAKRVMEKRELRTQGLTAADIRTRGSNDFRKSNPRFSIQNAEKKQQPVDAVKRVALRRAATPAQVALAWVLAQGDDIVPTPGTRLGAQVLGQRYDDAGPAMVAN